jgi:hypothetical protein
MVVVVKGGWTTDEQILVTGFVQLGLLCPQLADL